MPTRLYSLFVISSAFHGAPARRFGFGGRRRTFPTSVGGRCQIRDGIFFSGIVTMITSPLLAASATDTGLAPVSAANSAGFQDLVSWPLKHDARGQLNDE